MPQTDCSNTQPDQRVKLGSQAHETEGDESYIYQALDHPLYQALSDRLRRDPGVYVEHSFGR